MKSKHILSEIDEANELGTCSTCGPVRVYMHIAKDRATPRKKFRCGVAKKERSKICRERPAAKDKQKIRALNHSRKKKYGLTPKAFDELMSLQHGRCAVCDYIFATKNEACVDHDHVTNQVRGLLCRLCNLAEGHLRGSPLLARKLAEYLNKHAPKLRL